MRNFKLNLICIGMLLMTVACNNSDLDKNGYPKVFKIGVAIVSGGGDDVNQRFMEMEPLRLYLEKYLKVKVQFIPVSGYAPVVEALKAKKIHMATLSPYPYLIARKTANVKAILVFATNQGAKIPYSSCIIINKALGIKNIDDLKKKMKDLVIAFADPASTSGHIIPRKYLEEHGINPERDFKKVIFSENHFASILSVISGKLDVACVQFEMLNSNAMKEKNITCDKFDTIMVSKMIPQPPHCIRKDINPEFIKLVQQAYVNLKDSDHAAFTSVLNSYKKYISLDPDSFKFITVDERPYDDFELLVKDIKGIEIK